MFLIDFGCFLFALFVAPGEADDVLVLRVSAGQILKGHVDRLAAGQFVELLLEIPLDPERVERLGVPPAGHVLVHDHREVVHLDLLARMEIPLQVVAAQHGQTIDGLFQVENPVETLVHLIRAFALDGAFEAVDRRRPKVPLDRRVVVVIVGGRVRAIVSQFDNLVLVLFLAFDLFK